MQYQIAELTAKLKEQGINLILQDTLLEHYDSALLMQFPDGTVFSLTPYNAGWYCSLAISLLKPEIAERMLTVARTNQK